MMLRQSLKRACERGEDHGRRDAIQACGLLVSLRFGNEAGEWLLRETMSSSAKQGEYPKVNIIEFPGRELGPVRIEIPIGSVDQARRALECVSATVAVGLNLVDRSEDVETTLIGLRRLFDALNVLIERERRLVPLCQSPHFDQDPPGAA
jgi:hypothetical protein